MRLFISIHFSDELHASLMQSIDMLKKAAVKGNFTSPENLHLTLVFIGETKRLTEIKDVMERVSAKKHELTIGGLGKFKRDSGDIYWVGVKENPQLISIYETLAKQLKEAGFAIEARSYKPHITLGREVILTRPPEFEIPVQHMKVEQISLMKSERIGGKLTYTTMYQKELT